MTHAELSAARQKRHAGSLTPRQREVAGLASRDKGVAEISKRLGIAKATVKLHLSKSYGKLGISGRGAPRELRTRREEFGL